MKSLRVLLCALVLILSAQQASAQSTFFQYSDTLNPKRLRGLLAAESAVYASTMYGLYTLWYKDYPQGRFHWFGDGREWLQMDKAGHTMTAYEIGRFGIEAFKWSGLEQRKAALYGGLVGWTYQATIEVFDGFSAQWGASASDLLANTIGTGLVVGQELAWNEQRAQLKVSAHLTSYARYRPNTLGSTFAERIFKDYNGQTYWLSVSPGAWMREESKFPKWLAVSVGYGADGMIGGTANPVADADMNPFPRFRRTRQYYLSLDIDFTRLDRKSVV